MKLFGRTINFERRLLWLNVALLTVVAIAMFAVIFLVLRTISAERSERNQMQQTADVIAELRGVNRAALNGETGQRGYIITLDRRYLSPYFSGRDQIEPTLHKLRKLVEPTATERQKQLLDEIEVLSRAKFSELGRSVKLVEQGDVLGARRLILSDEGQEAMERLRRAIGEMEVIELHVLGQASAQTARAEGRVLPLLGGLLVLLVIVLLVVIRLVARAALAEAEAAQAKALGEARDRADLLARELNHRVKNLFAVILAIVQLSARDKPEAKDVTEAIARRIRALLTAHEVSQGELDRPVASLTDLVETSLAPYRSDELDASLDGPSVILPARLVTPLGLVLHELTTNAVKYGAWAHGGKITISWREEDGLVVLEWIETGAPIETQPERRGFGSLLMTSAARQLSGSIEREFAGDGAKITITFPNPGENGK